MAFKLDDIIIDRIQMAVAEDFDGNLLYTLTQLADATISITAETKDAVDAQGTLVKRFYQGKQGEFTANNAMINLNVIGAASGDGKVMASTSEKITMPKIEKVKAGQDLDISGYVDGTVVVNALSTNGTMGKAYKLGTTVGADVFVINTSEGKTTLKLPTDTKEVLYVVKYQRQVSEGAYIANKADKFPGTVRLTLKALCVDPCSADTLRACYIVLPSFQVNPDIEISLTTDAQLSYSGVLQVDYCAADKTLYEVYIAAEDEE